MTSIHYPGSQVKTWFELEIERLTRENGQLRDERRWQAACAAMQAILGNEKLLTLCAQDAKAVGAKEVFPVVALKSKSMADELLARMMEDK